MITKSSCPDRDALERLMLGEMPDVEMEVLEGHLSGCPRCLDRIRELKTEDGLVHAVRAGGRIGHIPREEVDESLIVRLCGLRREVITTAVSTRDGPAPDSLPVSEKTAELSSLLAPPEEPDELGRIGPFGILRILGSGGMGIVFAARQERPRRVVALKMIRSDFPAGRRLERFRSESEIIARLRHPNIIQVHEVAEHNGRPYFTMDQADGGSLGQKLAVALLAPGEASDLIQTLARAVHSAHEQGIVHRDLKPSNVLLAGDGTPLIGDFGLAKQLQGEGGRSSPGDCTETGAILGTPGYMAPEQAGGQNKEIGLAADVYALGAILYECLTGRPPFRAASVLETLEQVRNQEPVPLRRLQPGVPRDLETICLKCLAKEPGRRYASAADLADDLSRFLGGQPIRARPTAFLERLAKWARRRPALAGLVLVSGVALLALLVGGVVYEGRLQKALGEAQTNAEEAHREKDRADANYQKAREAVQRMLGRLEGSRLLGVPRLRELRQEQLEDALAFYQEVLHKLDSPSPAVRRDAAEAYEATAAIQSKLGRLGASAENYRQALGLLQGLADEQPEDSEYRTRLAACSNALGRVYLAARRLDEAEACQQKAVALADDLARTQPAVSRQEELARYHHDLANVCRRQERWGKAEAQYLEALALHERHLQERPAERRYQAAVAESYAHLTVVYQRMGRSDRMRETFRKAESVLGPLVRDFPEKLELALELAWLYVAVVPDDPEGVERGLAVYGLIVQTAEAALRQEPHLLVARQALLAAYQARGLLLHRLRRYGESIRDWDRLVELADEPARSASRAVRAASLAATGDHKRAAAEADALAAREQQPVLSLYNLACVYSVCLGAVLRDAKLSPSERRQQGEDYAARALALLRRVHAAGGLTPTDWYKEDPDLDPLRGRADFQKFVQKLGPRK